MNRERLRAIYDSRNFKAQAELWTKRLTQHLEECLKGQGAVIRWRYPEEMVQSVGRSLDRRREGAGERSPAQQTLLLSELLEEFFQSATRLHSPNYMAHQVPPSIPVAGLWDGLGAVTNQASGIYEVNPLTSAVERVLVERLGAKVGWPKGDGFLTHGGSAANLTALLAARNRRYPGAWDQGLTGLAGKIPAIITGKDTHYSIARAAGIMGIGAERVLKAEIDDKRRLTAATLGEALQKAKSQGLDVFAVVASSGTTPVGAFDPILELAEVTRREGLWLHVDGAHGASALFSERHRAKLHGLEFADSLVWDAHKMLFVPSLSTFVLFREGEHSYSAFHQDAPYLFDKEALGMRPYDPSYRTLECTRRAQGLPLWAVWSLYGDDLFRDLVDVTFETGREFFELLKQADDFETLNEPEANILCFRHIPPAIKNASPEKISAFQAAIRQRLVQAGDFYITRTILEGQSVLRVTLINPFTERHHLESLLKHIRRLGKDLLSEKAYG